MLIQVFHRSTILHVYTSLSNGGVGDIATTTSPEAASMLNFPAGVRLNVKAAPSLSVAYTVNTDVPTRIVIVRTT